MTKTATDSSLPALLEAMARLTPEERAQLQQRGAVLPHFGKTIDAQAKYGYRCKHCGKIGLEFIGEQFDNGIGELVDKPPLGLRLADLPWAQPRLRLEQINRSAPKCQYCLGVLPHSNGYGIEKYLVDIALYQDSRDKGFEALRESRRKSDKNQASHNPDGSPISLSSSYDTTRAQDDMIVANAKAKAEETDPGITHLTNTVAARGDLSEMLGRVAKTKGVAR